LGFFGVARHCEEILGGWFGGLPVGFTGEAVLLIVIWWMRCSEARKVKAVAQIDVA
jgi:hypothetical protein